METFNPKNCVILVVDDVRKNLQIIGSILDQVGYATTYAVGGKQALERVKTSPPDLILLDLMMPEINGLEVCETLKNDEKFTEIPIIFLTASHESDHLLQAFQKGAVDYITKPFNASELLARVRTHLELKYTRDKLKQAFQQIQELNLHLETELTEAANYVRSLLPEPLEDAQESIKTNWRFLPSQRLGGDCFNYYWLDEDHFIIYFFDVSGHGVASALLSISIRNILSTRSLLNTNFKDPERVLKDLNKAFSMSKHNDMYFTIWYGVYQKSSRMLTYASGGHPPAILINSESDQSPPSLAFLDSQNPPIGMMEYIDFYSETYQIPAHSVLYLLSDGVYDIINKEGKHWGFKTIAKILSEFPGHDAPILEQLIILAQEYSNSLTFIDDFSILQMIINH